MTLKGKEIGFAMTGSFCTFKIIFEQLEQLKATGANITPIFSNSVQNIDCRFGNTNEFVKRIEDITGRLPVMTLEEAEPIGPKGLLDILIIAPCTGNTLAKLNNAITDSPVLMAAKAHLRNDRPVVIFVSTNDGLSMNFKNIGGLLNCKNIYFVPFTQDNCKTKPNSLVAEPSLIIETLESALDGKQLQPVICSPK